MHWKDGQLCSGWGHGRFLLLNLKCTIYTFMLYVMISLFSCNFMYLWITQNYLVYELCSKNKVAFFPFNKWWFNTFYFIIFTLLNLYTFYLVTAVTTVNLTHSLQHASADKALRAALSLSLWHRVEFEPLLNLMTSSCINMEQILWQRPYQLVDPVKS